MTPLGSPGSRGPATELTQHELLAVADELTDALLDRAVRADLLDDIAEHRPPQLGPAIQRARLALAVNDSVALERSLFDVANAAVSTIVRIRRTA